MKKIVATLAIVVVALAAWLVQSRRESRAVQAHREAAHRTALAPYQHDLPLGVARPVVDKYLASRNASPVTVWGAHSMDGPSYQILVGEEEGDSFACDRWNVYVALEFNSSAGSREIPLPSDTLREIHIVQVGHCL